MKRGFIILLSILMILLLLVIGGLLHFKKEYTAYFEEIDRRYEQLSQIDLSEIPDGEYRAKYGQIPVYADLSVRIRDHAIDTIIINKQSSGPGYEALETLDRILRKQQVKVDAVSGATISSKCIMIAVHEALRQN
jgi:uncharacterized protein with FMN-binding domain